MVDSGSPVGTMAREFSGVGEPKSSPLRRSNLGGLTVAGVAGGGVVVVTGVMARKSASKPLLVVDLSIIQGIFFSPILEYNYDITYGENKYKLDYPDCFVSPVSIRRSSTGTNA